MHVDDEDGVRRITFDRPQVLNAFSTETAVELAELVAEPTPETHDAIVVTGEGDAFSAGGDIESMAERTEGPTEADRRIRETFGRLAEAMLGSEVPILARVNGDAVGAGLAIVALSDFAYAVEGARFSCAFVRVGLIPDTGGTFVLPRLVGLRTAKDLAFTGRFVDADEAASLDLINEAVPADRLDERVGETVDRLNRGPTRTIGLSKRAIHGNLGNSWRESVEYENVLQVEAYGTAEHEEGVSAFLDGRTPEFD